MSIKLTWHAGNTADAQILIYRNQGKTINVNSPGAPIVTLAGNVNSYTDTTTNVGMEYTYLIEAKTAYNSVKTAPSTQLDLRKRGPGSMDFLRGDVRYGLLGKVNNYDLPDPITDLKTALAASSSDLGALNDWSANAIWYKFCRKNKIYFVPDRPVYGRTGYHVSAVWVMANKGIASGIPWNFDTSAPEYAPFRKSRVVSTGGWTFNIRTARGFADDWDGTKLGDKGDKNSTEFAQLILPMYRGMASPNQVGSIVRPLTAFRTRMLTAETLADSTSLAQFVTPQTTNNILPYTSWDASGVTYSTNGEYSIYSTNAVVNSSMYPNCPQYWPILELVEE